MKTAVVSPQKNMTERVLIIKDYRGFLHQHLSIRESLNCDEIRSVLCQGGLEVEETTYDEILASARLWTIENQWIFYTSSQNPEYRAYCDSILYPLHQRNRLLPRYELFRCHEDKTFQELYLTKLGLRMPKTFVFATPGDLRKNRNALHFPMVAKLPSGFGSGGVFLVKTLDEAISLGKRWYAHRATAMARVKTKLKLLIRPGTSDSNCDQGYPEEFYGRMLLQEFVPGLTHDWKVLVFGDRYYALRRAVRPGDFRASGSGRREFVEPPEPVLSFARQCFEALDTPFVSLDIAASGDECYLLEFQATHFGPYTQTHSEVAFERTDSGTWLRKRKINTLEHDYGHAIVRYILGSIG